LADGRGIHAQASRASSVSRAIEQDRGSLVKPKQYNENLHVVSMDSLLLDPDQAVMCAGP
jgi:hypothetical protein